MLQELLKNIWEKRRVILAGFTLVAGFLFVNFICKMNVLEIRRVESFSGVTLLAIVIARIEYLYFQKYRVNIWLLLFSFIISELYITGYVVRLSAGGEVMGIYWQNIILAGSAVTPAVAYLICCIFNGFRMVSQKEGTSFLSSQRYYLMCLVVILAAWFPVFLAYYPGLFAYDVASQVKQIITFEFSTHHPLLHTLLLGFFYKTGEYIEAYNLGIAAYTLFQMLIVAMILSYALLYLYKKRVNNLVRNIIMIFFAICPINSVLAISITKDVLFSAFMLLFLVIFLEWMDNGFRFGKKFTGFLWIFSGTQIYLLRNNGKYVLLVFLIAAAIFLFVQRTERRAKIAGCSLMVAVLLCGWVTSFGLEHILDARSGKINEMCSVPCVQMARCAVYMGDELDEELKENYGRLNIIKENYSLSLADGIKGNAEIIGQEELFVSTWIKTMKLYPDICLDAFLYLHSGDLFLEDTSNAYIYGASLESRQGYLLTDTKEGFGVVHESKFPWLENIYERLFSENGYLRIPVVATIFSPALYFYGLLLCMLYALLTKNSRILFTGAFLVLYYGTMLLGPCSLIRYMFPLVITVPILLALGFKEKSECTWIKYFEKE